MKFNLLAFIFIINACPLSANPPVIEPNASGLSTVNNNQHIVNVFTGAVVTGNAYPEHYCSEFPGAGFVPHYYNNNGALQQQNGNGLAVRHQNQAG